MYTSQTYTYTHKRRLSLGPSLLAELAGDKVKEERGNVALVSTFQLLYFLVALIANIYGALSDPAFGSSLSVELFSVSLVIDVLGLFTAFSGLLAVQYTKSASALRYLTVCQYFCAIYVLSWVLELALGYSEVCESLKGRVGLSEEQVLCVMGLWVLVVGYVAMMVYVCAEHYYQALEDLRACIPRSDGTYSPPLLSLDR